MNIKYRYCEHKYIKAKIRRKAKADHFLHCKKEVGIYETKHFMLYTD